jgi:hypothetical protein
MMPWIRGFVMGRGSRGTLIRGAVTDPSEIDRDERARVGLCVTCRHASRIANPRGSIFYLCERSRTDPGFPRYPRLPVIACIGWEPLQTHEDAAKRGPRDPR